MRSLPPSQIGAALGSLSTQTPGTHTTEARTLILYGNTAGTGTPLDSQLTASNVAAPVWQTAGTGPLINTVTVKVTGYRFQPMAANMFGTAIPAITYGDISATMRSPL